MANIKTETITYDVGDNSFAGYLACNTDSDEARPGILVIHEWWGLTDYIRGRVNMLAEAGYTALGVDMYGDGKVATTPDEAGAAMNAILTDMDEGTRRLTAALSTLKSHAMTDAGQTAAIGYCFGGAMVLHMARTGMDVDGVVSFHGSLGSFHKPAPNSVKAKVLVCHGADDSLILDDDITAFKNEMTDANVDYDFRSYAGAQHSFTNPEADENGKKYGLPLAYHKATDEQSWADMKTFLNQVFA